MAFTTLVSTNDLASHLKQWRIFDCRHDLMKPEWGESQYREGHIPGAVFANLDRDLSAPKTGKNGRHPLPDPDAFAGWLGRAGLGRDDQVVCYDGANGLYASRLWWMLRWVGHRNVAVLDGGFAKWKSEGRPLTTTFLLLRRRITPSSCRKKPQGACARCIAASASMHCSMRVRRRAGAARPSRSIRKPAAFPARSIARAPTITRPTGRSSPPRN